MQRGGGRRGMADDHIRPHCDELGGKDPRLLGIAAGITISELNIASLDPSQFCQFPVQLPDIPGRKRIDCR